MALEQRGKQDARTGDEFVAEKADQGMHRRAALKVGAALATGGAVGLLGGQATAAKPQAPAVLTGKQAGRKFRAWVQEGLWVGGKAGVEELRLKELHSRQVVVRTEASAPCYSLCQRGIGGTPAVNPAPKYAPDTVPQISNHTAVGVVEAVASDVRRVKPGDRVIVGVVPQCGNCYMCLHGRADHCQWAFAVPDGFPPKIAIRADGSEIIAQVGVGGLAELTVCYEEYLCPIFTDLPADQLSLLGDTAATGFGGATAVMKVLPGSNVVVLGAGPVGLAAVMAARLVGAAQIIVSEPVKHRRESAKRLGATTVLDPNALGDRLVETIRELCKGPTGRIMSGGRGWIPQAESDFVNAAFGATRDNRGADFTIEAAGPTGDIPKVETPPDATGTLAMRQAWEMTRRGGEVVYLGFGQIGDVSYPAAAFANAGRTVHAGQQGGLNFMRDIPGMVALMEQGKYDLAPIVTSRWRLEDTDKAFRVASDRTELAPVVVFDS
ncbi:alcohol dehydrogenase (plasmid) [Sphingobium amiense]|uniref:Alcohol dehydrogenase n=2 Tax=Sphingobium TaxID=165695 RepID=A0A494WBQ5_9SPHN|nr:zinc-binding dehydrogenase [Sphingobium amiense]BBE00138.1 alcohol dehydrogenase [Sphingobium amiense]